MELSIVIPCLNEKDTIGLVVQKAMTSLQKLGLQGEVLVSDNGSNDGSVQIANNLGARVVPCSRKGYGNALKSGLSSAAGKYLIMGDADDSYNFAEIDDFIKYLQKDNDIVIGTRLRGKIEKGAMPFLHRYLGTPVLTFIINMLFGTKISDCNCGMRGVRKDAFEKLNLESSGMEFASEMIIKAGILKLKIKEIPISFYRDKRNRSPHLNTWRDGWRHLKFILLYAPNLIFMWPAFIFFVLGSLLMMLQINGPFILGPIYMGLHVMILGLSLSVFGAYIFQMGAVIKLFSRQSPFYRDDILMKWLDRITVEKGLIFGGMIMAVGLALDLGVVMKWAENGFHNIFVPQAVVLGLYFILTGMSLVFFSFLKTIMGKEG
ncbi:MAG: glycosyltransferase [Syntrophobacteraceae bacterium]|jgi:glycosyltransferase involved in cell wall biosynthesis